MVGEFIVSDSPHKASTILCVRQGNFPILHQIKCIYCPESPKGFGDSPCPQTRDEDPSNAMDAVHVVYVVVFSPWKDTI